MEPINQSPEKLRNYELSSQEEWNMLMGSKIEDLMSELESDATSEFVPTGVVMLKFVSIVEWLDWHMYGVADIDQVIGRVYFRKAFNLTYDKFDLRYRMLPR